DYIHARASLFNNQDVEDVPLDKVVVTQPKVNKDRVQEIIDKPETDEVTPILAVRYKGETYVLNGHHRVAANIKQGRSTITAHVLNLTENKQPILPKDSMQVTAAKEAATRVDHPDWTATDLGRTHETPEKTEITPPKNSTSVKPPTGRDDLQRYVSD